MGGKHPLDGALQVLVQLESGRFNSFLNARYHNFGTKERTSSFPRDNDHHCVIFLWFVMTLVLSGIVSPFTRSLIFLGLLAFFHFLFLLSPHFISFLSLSLARLLSFTFLGFRLTGA